MQLYTPDNQLLISEVDDKSYRIREIMSQHNVTIYVSSAEPIDFKVGCYLDFQGIRYTIRKKSGIKKDGIRNLTYTIIFESPQADTEKRTIRNRADKRLKFPYTATPREHAELIVWNLNQIGNGGFTLGECIAAERAVINYNHTKCWDGLKMITDTFNTEFEFVNKTLHIRKVEYNRENPLVLAYGRGNGLKKGIARENVDSRVPIEILAVQGGSRNINASKYGNSELLLPKGQTIAFDGAFFEDQVGFDPSLAKTYKVDAEGFSIQRADKPLVSYEDSSTDLSNIYPNRVGTVTNVEVTGSGNYNIYDTTIPENLDYSLYRIAGEEMSIIFQSGDLTAKEFNVLQDKDRITGYIHSQRKIMLVSQEYEGQIMPNQTWAPKVGDKYAVFGMMMPEEYIRDDNSKSGASWDMFRQAVKLLYEEEQKKFSFTGTLDGIWANKDWVNIGGKIVLGGYVRFTDDYLIESEDEVAESVLIRQTAIKDFINKPTYTEITLANVTAATYNEDFRKIPENEVKAEAENRNTVNYVKRSYRGMIELVNNIYDPSGSFQEDILSAVAVRAMMGAFGDELLQYVFLDETFTNEIEPNIAYSSTNKRIECDAAYIRHMTIGIDTVQPDRDKTEYLHWVVPSYNSAVLVDFPTPFYYLYLKVSKAYTTNEDGFKIGDGEWFISETKVDFDSDPDNYILWAAFINSEESANRQITNMFGFAELTPGMLRINNMASLDGNSYLRFLANQFKFGNGNQSIGWNVTEPNTLSLTNATVRDTLKVAGSALIAGFKFYNDWIESVKTVTYNSVTYHAVKIIGNDTQGYIELNSVVTKWTEDKGNVNVLQKIKIDSNTGEISSSAESENEVSHFSSQGFFSNRAGVEAISAATGASLKAAMVGLGFGKMDESAWGGGWGIVGVYGDANNSSANPAPAYGGWFNVLKANGLCLASRRVSVNTVLTNRDCFVSCYNASSISLNLPEKPYEGQFIRVRLIYQGQSVNIISEYNGNQIKINAGQYGIISSINISDAITCDFVYDGQAWIFTRLD